MKSRERSRQIETNGRVIVVGSNHHNTYGVIRSLAEKKTYPFLLFVGHEKDSFLFRSRLINGSAAVISADDAIDFLKSNAHILQGAVIIACSDALSSAIDSNIDSLSCFYKVPGSSFEGLITSLMDKSVMSDLAEKVGLKIPESWTVTNIGDINDVKYPCITKPILSKDGSKADISVCTNREELESVITRGTCSKYQVQEFIDKDFEYQLIGLSLNGGEFVIIPGFSRCIRPCPGTNTGFLHYEPLHDLFFPLERCKQFIKHTGYSGLFSIEFLRDKHGMDYFMEMNFRNDGNAICVTASGVNLPYLWCLANNNGVDKVQEELSEMKIHPIYVMPEFPDFDNFVRTRKISLITWIRDIIRTNTFMVFNLKDLSPFIYLFSNRIKSFLSKLRNA